MTRTLTIVVPVYNQAAEIHSTIESAAVAARRSSFETDVVVVDDGSTDGTAEAARSATGLPVVVVSQANAGRFAARRAGLERASGEYVLLLDSRVGLAPEALRFVAEQLDADEARSVWNAHVDIVVDGNPYAAFWDTLTRRAFAAYFADPRTTSFGLEEFDLFPKGTTCFFAPRHLIVEAMGSRPATYVDERHSNDDTPVIRWLAARTRINISPEFRCEYQSRRTIESFVRHAFHRGTVFVDGHARPESRFFPAVVAFYPSTIVWLGLARKRPLVGAAPLVLASLAGVGLAVGGGRREHAGRLALVTPLYALAHGAGMWRALLLVAGRLLRRGRAAA